MSNSNNQPSRRARRAGGDQPGAAADINQSAHDHRRSGRSLGASAPSHAISCANQSVVSNAANGSNTTPYTIAQPRRDDARSYARDFQSSNVAQSLGGDPEQIYRDPEAMKSWTFGTSSDHHNNPNPGRSTNVTSAGYPLEIEELGEDSQNTSSNRRTNGVPDVPAVSTSRPRRVDRFPTNGGDKDHACTKKHGMTKWRSNTEDLSPSYSISYGGRPRGSS